MVFINLAGAAGLLALGLHVGLVPAGAVAAPGPRWALGAAVRAASSLEIDLNFRELYGRFPVEGRLLLEDVAAVVVAAVPDSVVAVQ